jgi:membrane associated rhomboid family serine protease
MAYTDRYRASGWMSASYAPKGIKWLLLANVAVYILRLICSRVGLDRLFDPFKLVPAMVVQFLHVWQLFTYLFIHDTGIFHILFNMLALWMFGRDLEQRWGTRRFLQYYFVCGIGAGLCVVVASYLFGNPATRTIGASGAIFGLLLAFGLINAEVDIWFWGLFPVKGKYFVLLYGVIAFLGAVSPESDGVSHVAHLGGMAFGFFFMRSSFMRGRGIEFRFNPITWAENRYKDFKLQRAKKKFQVYMRKQNGRDRWVN